MKIIMSSECVALLVETLLSASLLEILDLWWIRYTPESANKLEYNTNLAIAALVNSIDILLH